MASLARHVPAAVAAWFIFACSTSAAVRGFKVTTDRTVDTTSLETIVADVWRLSGAKTNDEKAIALYEWLHNTIFHWAYPTEPAPQSVGPLKVINAYGWGLCGGQHTVLKALYETAGWECRYVGWSNPGHTTIEVKYDDRWHYFDVFLKCYFWTKDRKTIASQEEIAADPSIVLDAVKEGRAARQHLCCGDSEQGVISGCKSRRVVGNSKGWASVTWRDQNYSPLVNMPAGSMLRLSWNAEPDGFAVKGKPPQHGCGLKDIRGDKVLGPIAEHYGPRNWSNGTFLYEPDFSKNAALADIELQNARAQDGKIVATGGKGVAIFRAALPYPYVRAKVATTFEGGDGTVTVSTDAGKTWKTVAGPDISDIVRQRYDVFIKVEFPAALTKFSLQALIEHNRGAQPFLYHGRNVVTVSAEGGQIPAGCSLEVTYAFQEAADPGNRPRFDGKGLTYSEEKKVARRITSLPCTFDITVGGNTPPKMLYLERAVRCD